MSARTRSRKLSAASLIFLLTSSLAAAMSQAAGAGTPSTSQSARGTSDVITQYLTSMSPVEVANQQALGAYKSWLISQRGIYDAGFVESANYAKTKSTMLLWAGNSALQRSAVAEGARRGIVVTVKKVKYSRSQLQVGVNELWASQRSPQWHGFVIGSIAATDLTHDGLTVQGYFPDPTNASAVNVAAARTAAKNVVSARPAVSSPAHASPAGVAASDVQVAITPEPELFATATRSADYAPFNAGSMMRGHFGDVHCTSGFGIVLNGVSRITTAHHCADTPYTSWNLPNNSYGSVLKTVPGAGGEVLTGSASALMFDGAWNNSVGYVKTTKGFFDLSMGDGVCTSGASTGVHCFIKVTSLWISFSDGFSVFWTIRGIQQQSGAIAAGDGDSGGPVLVPYTGGSTVGAAGMIQGSEGTKTFNCGSVRSFGICSPEVEFSSMHTFVNFLPGSSLKTG